MDKIYTVYILSSISRSLYTGVTNSLQRRMREHKIGKGSVHAAKYNINRLVYFERHHDIRAAIVREKEIKSWSREKRLKLIEAENLGWIDLAENWFTDEQLMDDT